MIKNRKFGIIGGDLRQYYLAQSLKADNNTVLINGFDEKLINQNNISINLKNCSLEKLTDTSEFIVLPVPITRDRKYLNSPFKNEKIKLDSYFFNLLENKKVFGGIISSIEKSVKNRQISLYDYYREDFKILNAVPTAEGAVNIALNNMDKTLCDSQCLVMGYGRIGKVLADILEKSGAEVTVAARKIQDYAWITAKKYNFINISHLSSEQNLNRYDIIFNTIPYILLNEPILKKLSSNTLIIDLASEPGGVDKNSAKNLGLNSIHALGIPGKLFPDTAGKIVKQTLYKIIEEENL